MTASRNCQADTLSRGFQKGQCQVATCSPRYIFKAKQHCLASQSGLPGQRQGCSPWKSFVFSTALGLHYDTLMTCHARRKSVQDEGSQWELEPTWTMHWPLSHETIMCISTPYCPCTMTVGAWGGGQVLVHYTTSIQEAPDLSKRES